MITLTRYGLREWGGALAIFVIVTIVCCFSCKIFPNAVVIYACRVVNLLAFLFFLFVAFFFRNPVRIIPENTGALISPADGVVKDIEIVDDFCQTPFTGRALRIGIFLSVLNVHVNRTPAAINVLDVKYRPGHYFDARDVRAGKENEAMTISGEAQLDGKGFPLAVRQISGAIARRIVCPVKPGMIFNRGEIYGMIKFGSRTEIYLPVDRFEIKVKVGDVVHGGSSTVAVIK